MSARDDQIARMLETPCPECGGPLPLAEHECEKPGGTLTEQSFREALDSISQSAHRLAYGFRSQALQAGQFAQAAGIPVVGSDLVPAGQAFVVRDGEPRVFINGNQVNGISHFDLT